MAEVVRVLASAPVVALVVVSAFSVVLVSHGIPPAFVGSHGGVVVASVG